MRISRVFAGLGLALAILIGGLPAVLAADEPANIIKYRRNVMAAIGGNMGNLAMVAKGNISFAGNLAANARAIREGLGQAGQWFPEGTDTGETNALPKIWQDMPGFEQAMKDSIAAADDMIAAAETGDMQTVIGGLGALGKTCKGCHEEYRKKN
ncbi:MAG: cytochrome c [Alphaproteobacteria bacterium]|jgi:cytochrome c556|nr:cytochrome c [Alphaproteobacteria bacterium]